MRRLLALVFTLAAALPAHAETRENATFDIYIGGLKFGEIAFSAAENGSNYATASRVAASGLIGALTRARYDARSRGTSRGNRYTPSRYEVDSRRGSRETESYIDYRGGVPSAKVQTPPQNVRDTDLDPSTQGGTVDPSTAIWLALRDRPKSEACNVELNMYDGRYRAGISLKNPKADGDNLVCSGVYSRLGGYSAKELEDGRDFPFSATLVPTDTGEMRIEQITMESLYGTARVVRR